jgi:hypothetical protein
VEVSEPVVQDGGVTVVMPNGRRIEVKRGFDTDTLRRLVTALEKI